jgi:hypothetical protein
VQAGSQSERREPGQPDDRSGGDQRQAHAVRRRAGHLPHDTAGKVTGRPELRHRGPGRVRPVLSVTDMRVDRFQKPVRHFGEQIVRRGVPDRQRGLELGEIALDGLRERFVEREPPAFQAGADHGRPSITALTAEENSAHVARLSRNARRPAAVNR